MSPVPLVLPALLLRVIKLLLLRISQEWIRIAMRLTARGGRRTLLIGIEAAIPDRTLLTVTLDAGRTVPA